MREVMPAELADELKAPERRLIDPRSLPVRFSRLRHIARSAAHYYAACQGDTGDSAARRAGRAAHALTLGTPLAVWDGVTDSGRARPRNGKEWNAFKEAHKGAEIVNGKERDHAQAVADAVRKHARAAELLYHRDTKLEHEVVWTYRNGRRCVSHLDAYRPGVFVADLKCLRDGNPASVQRTAIWSYYHAQLACYVEAAEALGHPTPKPYLIVVENTAPFPVTVMPVAADALEAGRALLASWFAKLAACEAAGAWPGYAQDDVELTMPPSAGSFTVIVDGEDFAL